MDAPPTNATVEASAPLTRPWLRDLSLICLGIKCLLLLLGAVVCEVRFDQPFRETDKVLGVWHQWDSKHYFDIAENGYLTSPESSTLVFPPLLPLLIHAGAWVTGSMMSGGVLVVTILSFLPGLLLFQLARLDVDEETAFRAVLVLLLFPTSFFIHIAYTEGLFLTLVLGSFLAARRGRWGLVGILGALCGLTRINAVLLAPALLAEAWRGASRGLLQRWLGALSVGAGFAAYLGINYLSMGDSFAFVDLQKRAFYRTFAWPWDGAMTVWELAKSGGSNSMMNGVVQALFIPMLLIACVAAVRTQRLSYAIWTIGNAWIFTAQGFWLSIPRLSLVLFPAFIWLAPLTARPAFGALWFAASTLFLSLFAGQFAQGWWVS